MPEPEASTSGESALWVDPAEIPAAADIGKLGQALAAGPRGELDELMANVAAYAGLRQGELFALTAGQIATGARVITVDRKLVEVAGHLYVEAPKCRKFRATIYPVRTPDGYPLAGKLAARIEAGPRRAAGRHQPARADLPQPEVPALAVLQLRPPRPGPRLPGRRVARRARRRRLDLAQPAARVLHHRPVHLETRRHRRVPHGRPRQLPHHPRHVRRHHRRRPRPRPPSHPITRYRAGHVAHPATKERHSHVPRKGKGKMSHPDPRHPAEANGAYPYELPVHDSAITGTGTGMPGTDTRQYEEWHHADPPPRGAGGWDAMQEFGPPPDWADEGVFIAGDDDRQPEWDTGPASPTPPYGTPRHHPARRLPARLIATTAVVLLCITAITFVMFPRNHTIRISPADNPAATASQPTPGVQGGSTPSAAAEPAALTKAAAERILASYWQVNNTANESRSDTLLKTVEAGSSYSMDAGTYQMDRVTDPANRQYTAFTAENATYYIPRQPAGVYPRWFVVRVTYANLAAPQHATGAGYVLFTQAAKNAPWKNVLEPYMLPGTGPGPFIETDAHGYAIAASASDEAGLSVTSAQVQEATAESLDGSSTTVKNPGNLADLRDEAYFCGKLPAGSTDTDKHSASGRVFALKTVGGGVLAFYALTAQLTLAPPPGQTFQVSIPGFYSSSQTLTSATIGYAEQFATYIPPDQASPQILADASGITGQG